MFKLDDNLLKELGLGTLPPEEKNKMLAHIYETLEMRVGMKLAEQMSNEQLDEFEGFIDRNDEAGALKWLESNFPNYKQVVADELEKLKGEIKQAAPQIVAASEQARAAMPPMQPGTPAQYSLPQQPVYQQNPQTYTQQPPAPDPYQNMQQPTYPSTGQMQQPPQQPQYQQPLPQAQYPQPATPPPQPMNPNTYGSQSYQPPAPQQSQDESQQQA